MIEIFISGNELLLPNDFEVTIVEENPLITANGEFTLDITISLLEEMNARAFGFLQRINKCFAPDYKKESPANMIIDGKARYGKIIVLNNTEVSVTVQFLAGNSALNYDIRLDQRKIWELDWGKISTTIDYEKAYKSLSYSGWEMAINEFVCTPILANDGTNDVVYNHYTLADQNATDPYAIIGGERFIAQPYLMYYIEKLPGLLGLEMDYNILRLDGRALKMFVINTVQSNKYADYLPDITVAKFIETIENFFNVTILVNKASNKMNIESLNENIPNRKITGNINPLENYTRDVSNTQINTKIGDVKIMYDLPDSDYFKWQYLNPDILGLCEVKQFASMAAIKTAINQVADLGNKMVIYRTLDTGRDYLLNEYRSLIAPKVELFGYSETWGVNGRTGGYDILNINKFRAIGENFNTELKLELIPAELTTASISLTYVGTGTGTRSGGSWSVTTAFKYQLPKCRQAIFTTVESGLVEKVNGTAKIIQRLSNIEVALYTGKIELWGTFRRGNEEHVCFYPMSHVDSAPEFGSGESDGDVNWAHHIFLPAVEHSMRLHGSNGIVQSYHFTSLMDITKEYTFTLLDTPEVDINNMFVINNMKFMPISLTRKVSQKGSKVVEGKFYAML